MGAPEIYVLVGVDCGAPSTRPVAGLPQYKGMPPKRKAAPEPDAHASGPPSKARPLSLPAGAASLDGAASLRAARLAAILQPSGKAPPVKGGTKASKQAAKAKAKAAEQEAPAKAPAKAKAKGGTSPPKAPTGAPI